MAECAGLGVVLPWPPVICPLPSSSRRGPPIPAPPPGAYNVNETDRAPVWGSGGGAMRSRRAIIGSILGLLALAGGPAVAGGDRDSAAERGRIALTTRGYLPPAWPLEAYKAAGTLWSTGSPDPDADPAGYAATFNQRYGLHPAPYPNDGMPMGLRRATSR